MSTLPPSDTGGTAGGSEKVLGIGPGDVESTGTGITVSRETCAEIMDTAPTFISAS
jgi:hypothetical protein